MRSSDTTFHGHELPRRQWLQVSAATVLSALLLPDVGKVLGQEEAAKAEEREPSRPLEKLALKAMRSTLCLLVNQEGREAHGSAVLVKTPETCAMLLHPDEVLAVSVSHNFSNWNSESRVVAGRFANFDEHGKGERELRYPARLIGRFATSKGDRDALVAKGGFIDGIDVSLVAVRVPTSERPAIDELLLSVAPPDYSPKHRDSVVAVGFGSLPEENTALIRPSEALPPISWREGGVVGVRTNEIPTQFGPQRGDTVVTTVLNKEGDSGGGLFVWNTASDSPLLVGLCVSGLGVGKDSFDFNEFVPPPPEIIMLKPGESRSEFGDNVVTATSQEEAAEIFKAHSDKHMKWILDVEHRGLFAGSRGVYTLGECVASRYAELVSLRERIVASEQELRKQLEMRIALPGAERKQVQALDEITRLALKHIETEIAALKPPR